MSVKNTMQFADARFRLALAWARAGQVERAIEGFRQVLTLAPEHVPACVQLGHALLKLGYVDGALDAYAQALALDPTELEAQIRYRYLQEELSRDRQGERLPPAPLSNHSRGKINLRGQRKIKTHRSGWAFAQRALASLHNERGVLFDTRIEDQFARQHWQSGIRDAAVLARLQQQGLFDQLATSEEKGIVPYTQPWVGLLHNPPNMPHWFHYHESPQSIFAQEIWRRSVEHCRGLFAHSEYQAAWLRETTELTVSVIPFPTELGVRQFDFERFLANPNKKIIQVGWWLRQLSAIYRLPLTRNNSLGYEKIRLVPGFFADADAYLNALLARELAIERRLLEPRYQENTRELQHMKNEQYDELLTENITFALLYDAGANNLILECIARATPLLVNPLPAVVEFLGEDYPLYVENLDQAAAKALNLDLIEQAHTYLKNPDLRQKLSADYFLRVFQASAVYQALSPGMY